jgi:hypothetical protein
MVTIPAAARGGWIVRVSGGMSDSVETPGLTVSLNAWLNADGSVGGQGQYQHPDGTTYHLKVSEVGTGTVPIELLNRDYRGHQYAVAMGPVIGNEEGEWGAIVVAEGGETLPDAVWTGFVYPSGDMKSRFYNCSFPPDETVDKDRRVFSFPTDVLEGNFKIRTR